MKRGESPKNKLNNIRKHLQDLDDEFKLGIKAREKLDLYYKHIKAAEAYCTRVLQEGTNSHPDWEDKLEEHFKAAHALVLDIESTLRAEYKTGHKFLE